VVRNATPKASTTFDVVRDHQKLIVINRKNGHLSPCIRSKSRYSNRGRQAWCRNNWRYRFGVGAVVRALALGERRGPRICGIRHIARGRRIAARGQCTSRCAQGFGVCGEI
jgi:hypothetical protein